MVLFLWQAPNRTPKDFETAFLKWNSHPEVYINWGEVDLMLFYLRLLLLWLTCRWRSGEILIKQQLISTLTKIFSHLWIFVVLSGFSLGSFLCSVAFPPPQAFSFVFRSTIRWGDPAFVTLLENKKKPNFWRSFLIFILRILAIWEPSALKKNTL